MENLVLGAGFFLLYAAWKFMWKRSVLDSRRDQLFDLRDIVRDRFLGIENGLSSPVYKSLRDLLNTHISYTERLTFARFVATTIGISSSPDAMKRMRDEVDSMFKVDDSELQRFITEIREEANFIMISYMVETSMFMLFTTLIGVLIFEARQLIRSLSNLTKVTFAQPAFKFAAIAAAIISIPARAGLMDNEFNSSIIEEYSYQSQV